MADRIERVRIVRVLCHEVEILRAPEGGYVVAARTDGRGECAHFHTFEEAARDAAERLYRAADAIVDELAPYHPNARYAGLPTKPGRDPTVKK